MTTSSEESRIKRRVQPGIREQLSEHRRVEVEPEAQVGRLLIGVQNLYDHRQADGDHFIAVAVTSEKTS